ncbi:hypothetical protein CY34DRAFT_436644 [Suillus luteus UH-Slu-Lm8-n1]|uniref:Uncharacterized protein n=1 Tax=Suillus luteus UH-Slu-Lm8-n1 TaxID=930992 RepID=A0A0D0C2L0_9AGAM|nr:hypothetical protein CY34DRAFT_436644 [Suillus luteus UH-Slu-Lm8-n1]
MSLTLGLGFPRLGFPGCHSQGKSLPMYMNFRRRAIDGIQRQSVTLTMTDILKRHWQMPPHPHPSLLCFLLLN